ncbi:hypothetical protein GYMLUDRAFT_692883 [Collybiopsis luxurians FD-317 M1]|uniref:Uncharacterized protein n=1 Tax=Collybiopsis luxurians FD-317 M1 TaxID=944289 RepID=A0A0D0BTA1_9AGAR|nr:hypothetical protein GYMLUDRAFT_692883 [Collybiopsis luxurians FD-317 M1]
MDCYERTVSAIILQNATRIGGLRLGFDLPRFRDFVTPELVQEGTEIVQAALKPSMQQTLSDKQLIICLDIATSKYVPKKMDPFYHVLLSLIALRHPILGEKRFDIGQTWRPIAQGVDKVPGPLLALSISDGVFDPFLTLFVAGQGLTMTPNSRRAGTLEGVCESCK